MAEKGKAVTAGLVRDVSDDGLWVEPVILSSLRNAVPDFDWFRSSHWAILIGQNNTPGAVQEVFQ